MAERVDAVVIGMGPGGEELAGRLAGAGLEVVGIEKELVGGECPYWGCIPSKMMIRGADMLAEGRRLPGFAAAASVTPDWSPVARRVRMATDGWDDRVAVDRFVGKGGHFVRGAARLEKPGLVSVDGGEAYQATRAVVIATGVSPSAPPLPGLDSVSYWTNREAISAEEVPESLVVLGGGSVGAELAQVYARFGARVTVLEAGDRLLPMEEPVAGSIVRDVFAGEGVEVRTGARAVAVSQAAGRFEVRLDSGDRVTGDRLLVATGRRARLGPLRAATVGIDESLPAVPVDDRMRAGERLWAIGDVVGKGQFTHMAMYQAKVAAGDILDQPVHAAEYQAVSRVTFTDPEVGSVGLTAAQAADLGVNVRTGSTEVPSTARGWIHGPGNEGVISLVEDADRGVLVGATSVGPHGGEVLSLLALAVHAAVPTERLREMIFAYPTFWRGIEDALRNLATSA